MLLITVAWMIGPVIGLFVASNNGSGFSYYRIYDPIQIPYQMPYVLGSDVSYTDNMELLLRALHGAILGVIGGSAMFWVINRARRKAARNA